MSDTKKMHLGFEFEDEEPFVPGSDTMGRDLVFDATYQSDVRWRVPPYLQSLSLEQRGDVMYHVHCILGNIDPHGSIEQNFFESQQFYFRSDQAQRYLAEQIPYSKRILH